MTPILFNWYQEVINSLRNVWFGFVGFLDNLLGALVVFIIGWIVAAAVGQVVARLVSVLKIDQVLEKLGVGTVLERAGLKLDSAGFVGWLVKWFLILIAFLAAVDILGLQAVAVYLRDILGFIPNVIVAVLILLVAVLIGDLVDKVIVASVKAAELKSAETLGRLARWAIYFVAILAALVEVGVAEQLLLTLFTGLVAMLAIAGGLAFGMGGQGVAKEILEKTKKDLLE